MMEEKQKMKKGFNRTMKIIAALCMLIDHIGFVFFPMAIGLRMIGRLAMPIFAYCLGRGLVYTRSKKRYMMRLVLFAIVSQLPFYLLQQAAGYGRDLNLNIGFTFLLAACTVWCLELSFEAERKSSKVIYLLAGIIGILLSEVIPMDYGSYGVLVVLSSYLVIKGNKPFMMLPILYTIITVVCYGSNSGMLCLQEIGVLGYGVCYLLSPVSEKRWGKFFYIFYPLHMMLLWGAKCLL